MHRAALALALTIPLASQHPTLHETHVVLPRDQALGVHLASGDIDGDGHEDHLFSSNVALLGRADGSFTVRWSLFAPQLFLPFGAPQLTLADLDGDGDLDAAAPRAAFSAGTALVGGGVEVFVNDGSGAFVATTTLTGLVYPTVGEHTAAVAAGDIDGDGDRDLVVAVRPHVYAISGGLWQPPTWHVIGGQNRLWLNEGAGTFIDATYRLGAAGACTTSVALADLDSDGDLDIYFGNTQTGGMASFQNEDRLLRNQGNGLFTNDATFQPGPTNTLAVHARDYDADGDIDVLLHDTQQPRFLRNGGSGAFTVVPLPLPTPAGSRLAVGDFDADGFVDFGVCTPTSWQPVRNVSGTFTPVTAANQSLAGYDEALPLVVDLERDGDLDVLLTPTESLRARWLRNIAGVPSQLVAVDLPELVTNGLALAVGDLDGDGATDVLLGAHSLPSRVFRNDGDGNLMPVTAGDFAVGPAVTRSLALADLDGDGDLDVAAGRSANGSEATVAVFRNQAGTLVLQPPTYPLGDQVAAGDLDGDGDVDLYVARSLAGDVMLQNQGNGTFVIATGAVPSGVWGRVPRLADIDADGDLDVVANRLVLQNSGAGTFTMVATTGVNTDVPPLVGDFDGDLDIDFVLGASLFRNDGTGVFTSVASGLPQTPTSDNRASTTADFDGDGDLDVLLAFAGTAGPAALYTNDGSGAFTLVPGGADDAPTWTNAIATADLDSDGDLDAVLATGGLPRVWWNRTRHCSWRTLPRVGYPLVLDIEGRANDPFALALAFTPARLPIPGLGTLRLDPASLFVMATGALDASGKAALQLSVPAGPALVGLTVYWQALTGSAAQFSNLERATLLAQ